MKQEKKEANIWCIIGFVCSFLIPILGLLFSIIGLHFANKNNEEGKGFAIAGIIISIVFMVIAAIIYTILFASMMVY